MDTTRHTGPFWRYLSVSINSIRCTSKNLSLESGGILRGTEITSGSEVPYSILISKAGSFNSVTTEPSGKFESKTYSKRTSRQALELEHPEVPVPPATVEATLVIYFSRIPAWISPSWLNSNVLYGETNSATETKTFCWRRRNSKHLVVCVQFLE